MSKTIQKKTTKKNRHRKNNSSKKSKKIKISQRGGAAPAPGAGPIPAAQGDARNRIKECLSALRDTGEIVCSYIYHDGIHDTLAAPACDDKCNDSAYAIFNDYDDINNNSILSQGGQFYAVDKGTYYDQVKKGTEDGFKKYSIRIAADSGTEAQNIRVITSEKQDGNLSEIFPKSEEMASILDAGDHKYFPFPCSLSNIFDSASVGKAPTNISKRHYHAANTADFADVIYFAEQGRASHEGGGYIPPATGHLQACLALTLSIVLNCFSAAYLNYNDIIDSSSSYNKDGLCKSTLNKKKEVLGIKDEPIPRKATGICTQSGGFRSTQYGGALARASYYKNRFVLPTLYFLANFTVTNIDKKCNATGIFHAGGGGAQINVLALVEAIASEDDEIGNPFSGVKIFTSEADPVGQDMTVNLQNPTLINISQSQMAAHINKICPERADQRSDKGANSPIIREFVNYLATIGVDLNYKFIYVETMARLLKALGDRGHLTLAIMYASLLKKEAIILTGDRLLNAASIKSIHLIKNQLIKSKISISINNRKVLQELVQYSDLLKQIAASSVDMSDLNICFLYRSVEPYIEVKNSAKALFNLLYGRSDFMKNLKDSPYPLSVLQIKCILRMYIILKNNTVIHTDNRPKLRTDDDSATADYSDVSDEYKSGNEYKVFAYAMLKSFEKYTSDMAVEGEAENADEFTDPTNLDEGLTLPFGLTDWNDFQKRVVIFIDSQIETAKQLLRIDTINTQINLLNEAFGTDRSERKRLLNQAFLGYKIGLGAAYTELRNPELREGPNWRYTPLVDPIGRLGTNANKSIFNSEHTISRDPTRFDSSFIKLESDCGNTYYVNKSFSKISTIVDLLYSIVIDIKEEEEAARIAAEEEAARVAAEEEAARVAAEEEAARIAAEEEAARIAAEEEEEEEGAKPNVSGLKDSLAKILLERQGDTLEFMSVLVIAYNTFFREGQDVSRILHKGGLVMKVSSDRESEKQLLISKFSKFFNQIKEILGILSEYPQIGELNISQRGGMRRGSSLHPSAYKKEGTRRYTKRGRERLLALKRINLFQGPHESKEELQKNLFFIPKLLSVKLRLEKKKGAVEQDMIIKHLATEILTSIPIDMLKSERDFTAETVKQLEKAYLDRSIPSVESTESSEEFDESIQEEELIDLRHIVMILFYNLIQKIKRKQPLINEEEYFDRLVYVLDYDKTYSLQQLSILSSPILFNEIVSFFYSYNPSEKNEFLSKFIFDSNIFEPTGSSDFQKLNLRRRDILKHYFEVDEYGSFKYPATFEEFLSIVSKKEQVILNGFTPKEGEIIKSIFVKTGINSEYKIFNNIFKLFIIDITRQITQPTKRRGGRENGNERAKASRKGDWHNERDWSEDDEDEVRNDERDLSEDESFNPFGEPLELAHGPFSQPTANAPDPFSGVPGGIGGSPGWPIAHGEGSFGVPLALGDGGFGGSAAHSKKNPIREKKFKEGPQTMHYNRRVRTREQTPKERSEKRSRGVGLKRDLGPRSGGARSLKRNKRKNTIKKNLNRFKKTLKKNKKYKRKPKVI